MSFRVVLDGEQAKATDVEGAIASYDERPVHATAVMCDHGNDPAVAAGWTTIVLQILGISAVAFFTIPAATKKIRDACSEWKNIYRDLNAFLEWLTKQHKVYSYSAEVVFLDALAHLESKTSVMELTLTNWHELPLTRLPGNDLFTNTTRIYYEFLFENADTGVIYILLFNSQRTLLAESRLGMYLGQKDQFWCT